MVDLVTYASQLLGHELGDKLWSTSINVADLGGMERCLVICRQ